MLEAHACKAYDVRLQSVQRYYKLKLLGMIRVNASRSRHVLVAENAGRPLRRMFHHARLNVSFRAVLDYLSDLPDTPPTNRRRMKEWRVQSDRSCPPQVASREAAAAPTEAVHQTSDLIHR